MFFIITGPSGSGKSVLCRRILNDLAGLRFSVSYTTREKRASEKEGEDYYFVDAEEFKRLIEGDLLLEWAIVHGSYYGTSREEVETKSRDSDLVLDIDVQGARRIRESGQEAVFIFILPPSYAELKRRLESRGQDSPETIRRRLRTAKTEIEEYTKFDFLVVNDDLDQAAKDLGAIILSRRCLLEERSSVVEDILRSFSESKERSS